MYNKCLRIQNTNGQNTTICVCFFKWFPKETNGFHSYVSGMTSAAWCLHPRRMPQLLHSGWPHRPPTKSAQDGRWQCEVSQVIGVPPNHQFLNWDFPLETIQLLGYHHLWKHQCSNPYNRCRTMFPGWFVDDVSSIFSNKSNNFWSFWGLLYK